MAFGTIWLSSSVGELGLMCPCALCRYFESGARELEAKLPGLKCLSSGYAAVRADDGICGKRDRHVAASSTCADYEEL